MLGDGAVWIKFLRDYFGYNPNIQTILGLDKYHFKQSIWRTCSDKSIYNALCEYVISDNKKEYKRLIGEIIDLYPDKTKKIKEYEKYILNNWPHIQNLYKYNLSCPMESQISHTFASYFTSRPKAYNKNTIDKLITLRLLRKNNYNIKQLFFNNINSNTIIDLNNNDTINYSIFDEEEIYEIIFPARRKYYLGY